MEIMVEKQNLEQRGGTANIKTCPLLLNILTNGPVVMNHGRRKKKMGGIEAAITSHKNIRM